MRQVRKLSNLIADELEMQGLEVGSALFESTVSSIVKSVNEALKDADKKDAGNTDVFEEVEEGSFYFATADTTLGDYEVNQDEIVELVTNGEPCVVNIYDSEGELREEGVEVPAEAFVAFVDSADEVVIEDVEDLFDEDEEEVEEGAKISFKGGKKRKINAKKAKLLLKSKEKGEKWKVQGDKLVRRTTAEIKASKKNIKKAKKGKAKAKKNRKKAMKANESVVVEGFDISANGTIFHVEDGDVLSYEDGFLSVTRDGVEVFSNLTVSESFISRCISEGVVEDCEDCEDEEEIQEGKKRKTVKEDDESEEEKEDIKEDSDEDDSDEDDDDDSEDSEDSDDGSDEDDGEVSESLLTFRAGKGYCLVSEGRELQMGNRIRARAMLLNQGFEVSSADLDKASNGQVVVL
jgi:putative uncharacterized protein (fragment)|nr:MAG TPA: hypothetical protein [Bacteriophage sp.]